MYTVEQIRDAVERFQNYPDGDYEAHVRDYPEGHVLHNTKWKQTPPESWDDVDGKGFLVIDGEFVDYEVVHTTGGMDEGSYASVVLKVGDQYFRKEGYYASHYGTDWDGDLEEVRPKVVERVEYVAD